MYNIIIILLFLPFLIQLTFTATSSSQDFTFSQSQSFIRVQPDWPLTSVREVKFHFKTVQPHGLLLYHGLTNLPEANYPHYEMYLMLENARLRFIHVFGQDNTADSYYIGKGLNQDKWHNVRLKINPATADLYLSVDNINMNITLPSLIANPNYNLNHSVSNSFLYFGGTNAYNPILNRQYNYVRFVGCLGNITFGHSDNSMEPVTIESFYQTEEGCNNRCKNEDWCLHGGRCVNQYKRTVCDCFGTGHEGPICQNNSLTTVTLRGYSYLTYRIYYWKDRVQSEANMLSLLFRTYVADSVLLYGAGEHPEYNYMAISIFRGKLYFEIDFGDGPLNTTLGYLLHDEIWHNVTVIHHGKVVKVMLDNRYTTILEATGDHHHLHLDPEVYIGGAPLNAKGLRSHKKFVGCLKELYFNRKNILFSLHEANSAVRHYGIFLIEHGCSVVDVIPLTFRLKESRLLLNHSGGKEFDMTLEFKTLQRECVLASGFIEIENRRGIWEVNNYTLIV
ncbi:neurexin-1a-like [Centruroides sculpturatus]|uniref:neurexin-1a-like n=1 Tax=Centruroides sculpturatus TaxID=218467 RepID=UPI000C6DEC56|nr:neurexin-1a-like [Centruroides sculpturatus]